MIMSISPPTFDGAEAEQTLKPSGRTFAQRMAHYVAGNPPGTQGAWALQADTGLYDSIDSTPGQADRA